MQKWLVGMVIFGVCFSGTALWAEEAPKAKIATQSDPEAVKPDTSKLGTPTPATSQMDTAASPQANPLAAVGPDRQLLQKTVDRGLQYLASAQADNGSWSGQMGMGPTALATLAFLRHGRTPADPAVAKALKHLEEYVQENGGIYTPGGRIATYETCIALLCFQQANSQGQYKKILQDAEAFLRGTPWDETRGKNRSDLYYGGAGYSAKSRPDLSNTAFLIEALRSAGAKPDDPAIQRALVFVSRCQNLESEHNTTPWAAKINDGGFYYTCVLEKPEQQRQGPEGGLRSYGSMTYAGLKSMVYAGLTKDDPRVKAVLGWVRKYYSVSENPGMGDAGLYYYYHTFAKALAAAGMDLVEDAQGRRHDWRRELTEELARRQKPDGSWVNTNPRWMEGDANLCTAFALLALSYCQPPSAQPGR
ncbi:MAG: terpene cyclase/mutase family protein [Thermoguttaceae bacterium]|nr:terpene cyclase/mutase family protein [Thermoguttaceae bacterium]MDW8039269.1 terpene cyclase/mutase family protein [Thermoguttaceae bacterium]